MPSKRPISAKEQIKAQKKLLKPKTKKQIDLAMFGVIRKPKKPR